MLGRYTVSTSLTLITYWQYILYRKIQEESLRTFIFTFSETYDTLRYVRYILILWAMHFCYACVYTSHVQMVIKVLHVHTWRDKINPLLCVCSLERLSQMFELPVKEVHSIVSRMIIKEELLVRAMDIRMYCAIFMHYTLCRHHWMNPRGLLFCIMQNPTNCSARPFCWLRRYIYMQL